MCDGADIIPAIHRSALAENARLRKTMSAPISYVIASILFLALAAGSNSNPASPAHGMLVVANQGDHTALLIDPRSRQELMKVTVGINGHEVAVSPDSHFAYVPIYGNSGVGKPGTDGHAIDII